MNDLIKFNENHYVSPHGNCLNMLNTTFLSYSPYPYSTIKRMERMFNVNERTAEKWCNRQSHPITTNSRKIAIIHMIINNPILFNICILRAYLLYMAEHSKFYNSGPCYKSSSFVRKLNSLTDDLQYIKNSINLHVANKMDVIGDAPYDFWNKIDHIINFILLKFKYINREQYNSKKVEDYKLDEISDIIFKNFNYLKNASTKFVSSLVKVLTNEYEMVVRVNKFEFAPPYLKQQSTYYINISKMICSYGQN